MVLQLKVIPNASRAQIVGKLGEHIKVKVTSPPEKGKANKEIIALFAKHLNIPKKELSIISGQTSCYKTLEVRTAENINLE